MLNLTNLEPGKHYLGNLCKSQHDWKDTGKSARYQRNGLCVVCKRESHKRQMQDPNYALKLKQRWKETSRKRRSDPDKRRKMTQAVVRYNAKKRQTDRGHLEARLRARVRRAFNVYTKTGKMRTAKEYGIDYKAIIEQLGVCPGARDEYHVDHIIPLSLFDLADPEQVKLAFAPENHQWLKVADNIRKGNKVNGISASHLEEIKTRG